MGGLPLPAVASAALPWAALPWEASTAAPDAESDAGPAGEEVLPLRQALSTAGVQAGRGALKARVLPLAGVTDAACMLRMRPHHWAHPLMNAVPALTIAHCGAELVGESFGVVQLRLAQPLAPAPQPHQQPCMAAQRQAQRAEAECAGGGAGHCSSPPRLFPAPQKCLV